MAFISYSCVLVGVGFVISYNPTMSGGTPSIMGHSSDEVMVRNSSGDLISLQTFINQRGVGGVTNVSGKCVTWFSPVGVGSGAGSCTSLTSGNYLIVDLVVGGENICADGDGCLISTLSVSDAEVKDWGNADGIMFQFNDNKFVASMYSSETEGTNGDATSSCISTKNNCHMVDDYGTDNSPNKIVFADENNGKRCFFRVCD